jgi:hypothetical protein
MESVPTYGVLKSVGFIEYDSPYSEGRPALCYYFDRFKLDAIHGISFRCFRPVVLFTGVLQTTRSIHEIEFEMPQEVESREQGIAFLAYYLELQASPLFEFAWRWPWLEEGRQYKHLLPWERERIAYEARPVCWVDRDWARVGLRRLREYLADVADEELVVFAFDGEVLTIRCAGKLIAMPGEGNKWESRFALDAGKLRQLPKRLMDDPVGFSMWDGAFRFGGRAYGGVVTQDTNGDHS